MNPESKSLIGNGVRLVVCFDDKLKQKKPITLENPDDSNLKKLNDEGFGIFETANSFDATKEQLIELAKIKGKVKVTKRNKEFLRHLHEVFADVDVCKKDGEISVEVREQRKKDLKKAIDDYCPASVYIITKNGLQPRWWIEESGIDELTQQKYVNIVNGIIDWSKKHGALGDPVKDVTRVLRKPGYYHHKSEPYLITEEKGNGKTYTLDELKNYFWLEPVKKSLELPQDRNENNNLDSLDIRTVVIDVWKEKGHVAEFDSDGHLIINGDMTATFKGRRDDGNYMATTSGDYPAKGNAVTYVAETLGISTKDAYQWLKKKYVQFSGQSFSERSTQEWSNPISITELAKKPLPEKKWIVEKYFVAGTINQISGDSNNWKSWVLLHAAIKIAKGEKVFDVFDTKQSGVLIVNEEDPEPDIEERLHILGENYENLHVYFHVEKGIMLDDGTTSKLIADMKKYDLEVIFFDSLSVIHDKDENSSREMNLVFNQMKRFILNDFTVFFTHHLRKKPIKRGIQEDSQQRTRGSTVINTRPHGHINCEEKIEGDKKYILIEQAKLKGGKKVKPILVRIDESDEKIKLIYERDYEMTLLALDKAEEKIVNLLFHKKVWLSVDELDSCGSIGVIRVALRNLEKKGRIIGKLWRELSETDAKTLPSLKSRKHNSKLYTLPETEEVSASEVPLEGF